MLSDIGKRIARERVVSRPLRLLVRDNASTQSIRSSVERVGEDQSKLIGSHPPIVANWSSHVDASRQSAPVGR
jgi:hypothetical protein